MAFFVVGLMMLSIGIYLTVSDNTFSFITGSNIASGAVLLIVVGFIITVITMVGTIGAIMLWPILLVLYTVIMSVVLALEIIAGSLAFAFNSNLVEYVNEQMNSAIEEYRTNNDTDKNEDINNFIDFFQEEFSCCGYDGPEDWLNTVFMNTSSDILPFSCRCNIMTDNCNATFSQYPSLYVWNEGCGPALINVIERYIIAIGTIATIFGAFQIIGMVLAIYICVYNSCQKKNKSYSPNN